MTAADIASTDAPRVAPPASKIAALDPPLCARDTRRQHHCVLDSGRAAGARDRALCADIVDVTIAEPPSQHGSAPTPLGRDVYSAPRLWRRNFAIHRLVVVIVAAVAATMLGGIAALFARQAEEVIMRITDLVFWLFRRSFWRRHRRRAASLPHAIIAMAGGGGRNRLAAASSSSSARRNMSKPRWCSVEPRAHLIRHIMTSNDVGRITRDHGRQQRDQNPERNDRAECRERITADPARNFDAGGATRGASVLAISRAVIGPPADQAARN